jgi:hypothetical protein
MGCANKRLEFHAFFPRGNGLIDHARNFVDELVVDEMSSSSFDPTRCRACLAAGHPPSCPGPSRAGAWPG